MEHESFEDPATAALMNEHFVTSRWIARSGPDLDRIYMDAVQAMTGHGRLAAVGVPDAGRRAVLRGHLLPAGAGRHAGVPAGPRGDRRGVAGPARGGRAAGRADRRGDRARPRSWRPSGSRCTGTSPSAAFERCAERSTRAWGGFGGAPKFPQPMTLEFLLRRALRGDRDALGMVTHHARPDGRRRHLRSARRRLRPVLDRRGWLVPHFEKMLYDNAQLARLYIAAWQVTRDGALPARRHRDRRYLLREMRHPEGGFSSSQDADSEGVEGTFFAWTWDELTSHVTANTSPPASAPRREGNWEGTNVLWRPFSPAAYATEQGLDPAALEAEVDAGAAPAVRAP